MSYSFLCRSFFKKDNIIKIRITHLGKQTNGTRANKGNFVCLETDASNNNTSSTAPLISYTEFYNSTLDHIDLMKEYLTWQSPDQPGQFSYCQYPFILSIAAKRFILTKVIISTVMVNASA